MDKKNVTYHLLLIWLFDCIIMHENKVLTMSGVWQRSHELSCKQSKQTEHPIFLIYQKSTIITALGWAELLKLFCNNNEIALDPKWTP